MKKYTIGILCSLLRYMNGSFNMINKAAKNNAFSRNRSPYSSVVDALMLNEPDLKQNVLTFVNWMIFKCPSEKKMCKFLARLENLGLY